MSVNESKKNTSIFGMPLKKGGLNITLLKDEKPKTAQPPSVIVDHFNVLITIASHQTYHTKTFPAELTFENWQVKQNHTHDERYRDLFDNVTERDPEMVMTTIKELIEDALNPLPDFEEFEEVQYSVTHVQLLALNEHVVNGFYLETVNEGWDTEEGRNFDYVISVGGLGGNTYGGESVRLKELPKLRRHSPRFPLPGGDTDEQVKRDALLCLFREYAKHNRHKLHRDADRFIVEPRDKRVFPHNFDSAMIIIKDNEWNVYVDYSRS